MWVLSEDLVLVHLPTGARVRVAPGAPYGEDCAAIVLYEPPQGEGELLYRAPSRERAERVVINLAECVDAFQ